MKKQTDTRSHGRDADWETSSDQSADDIEFEEQAKLGRAARPNRNATLDKQGLKRRQRNAYRDDL